jgi:hypothetical protein
MVMEMAGAITLAATGQMIARQNSELLFNAVFMAALTLMEMDTLIQLMLFIPIQHNGMMLTVTATATTHQARNRIVFEMTLPSGLTKIMMDMVTIYLE